MIRKNLKFIIGGFMIVSVVAWIGATGFQEGKAYYKTADELVLMGEEAYNTRLKVSGNVVEGSIAQEGRRLTFDIEYNGAVIPVEYVGSAIIPDSFDDSVQTVIEGFYTRKGVFEAKTIQAKCASKYEADYTDTKEE
ncbi:MAG: hypothetical protein B6244_10170 [Candidatus Cloacimonetes bacterium 4572_55]|nr:MAG: hypothetical protein B6244_10170 [Candidatus Cloacimonetes bacterium 4572_55]